MCMSVADLPIRIVSITTATIRIPARGAYTKYALPAPRALVGIDGGQRLQKNERTIVVQDARQRERASTPTRKLAII